MFRSHNSMAYIWLSRLSDFLPGRRTREGFFSPLVSPGLRVTCAFGCPLGVVYRDAYRLLCVPSRTRVRVVYVCVMKKKVRKKKKINKRARIACKMYRRTGIKQNDIHGLCDCIVPKRKRVNWTGKRRTCVVNISV